ncbi:MAG: pirin family protein [Bacteroidota bacterium]
MKTVIHKSDSRGHADHGWLNTYHSFSFANYHNSDKVHFGMLRVLNDDYVAEGMGFGTHPHDNMEIVTIVTSGALEHRDSMGNTAVIKPNEVQIMSAGTGITHSEYNHSKTEPVKLFQIWVFPKERNIKPRYDQKLFSAEEKKNKLLTVVSPSKENSAVWINQDAWFSLGSLEKNKSIEYNLHKKGNGVYVFVIEGEITAGEIDLGKRDGVGISDADKFNVTAKTNADVLLIEIPMN